MWAVLLIYVQLNCVEFKNCIHLIFLRANNLFHSFFRDVQHKYIFHTAPLVYNVWTMICEKNPSRSLSLSKYWGCCRKILRPGKIIRWEFAAAVRRRFLTSLFARRKHQSKMKNGIQQLFINYSLKMFPNHAYFYARCQSLKHLPFPMQSISPKWKMEFNNCLLIIRSKCFQIMLISMQDASH